MKKYNIIYADPPWYYYGDPNKNAAAGKHYPLMKTEEIMHVIREVIEERMGLRLGRAEVRIRHAPYPEEMNQNTITGSV